MRCYIFIFIVRLHLGAFSPGILETELRSLLSLTANSVFTGTHRFAFFGAFRLLGV